MQARIRKTDLEAFRINAQAIETDKLLPILSFIKIEIIGDFCSLTKSNLKSFVIHNISNDSEDCSFLIEENVLFNFLDLSESQYINFFIEGIRVTINDERHRTSSPTENVKMYPQVDLSNEEWIKIPKSVIEACKVCTEVIFDDEIQGIRNSIFVGDRCVAGSDATIGYLQKFDFDLPKLVLKKEVVLAMCKLEGCEYSYNRSYNLFRNGEMLFGFVKSEVEFIDLKPIFKEIENPVSFFLNKSEFIKWNTYCINAAKSKILTATFKGTEYKLELEMIDPKYEFNTNSFIPVINGEGEFKFNPVTMNQILKCLPAEQINFYPGLNRYYLTDNNKSFMAAIMLIN